MLQIEWTPDLDGMVHIICTEKSCCIDQNMNGAEAFSHLVVHMRNLSVQALSDIMGRSS